MANELLEEIVQTGIQAIKENRKTEKAKEENDATTGVKKTLLDLKKDFVEKYVEKKINNPILQLTGVVEDYMVNEGFVDTIKDKVIYEGLLEKSNLETETLNEIKRIKGMLQEIKTEAELTTFENNELNTNNKTYGVNIEQKDENTTKEQIPEKQESNQQDLDNKTTIANEEVFIIPEGLPKDYINKVAEKFSGIKKENIKKYGPLVIKEAIKNKETKDIIPQIFAQINKESGRDNNRINDKGEFSIGFMQINKNAGHTGHINNKYYNIDTPDGNIKYGIAFLANCIKKSGGNIRDGFNRYNGLANMKKTTEQQYAHSILNDKKFNIV